VRRVFELVDPHHCDLNIYSGSMWVRICFEFAQILREQNEMRSKSQLLILHFMSLLMTGTCIWLATKTPGSLYSYFAAFTAAVFLVLAAGTFWAFVKEPDVRQW
jgi:hypothetical protein